MEVNQAYSDNENKHGKHRQLNYEICTVMDPIRFGIVLNKMVDQGMNPEMVVIYEVQFRGLLAALRTENNRISSWS